MNCRMGAVLGARVANLVRLASWGEGRHLFEADQVSEAAVREVVERRGVCERIAARDLSGEAP